MNKNINYKNITDSINNIFLNANDDISKCIFESYNIITRKTKLSFSDALIYSLQYCKNDCTKIDIINKFNKEKKEIDKVSRTTYHEKASKIPLSYFSSVYKKLNIIYSDNFIDKNKKLIISVDGVYGNSNVKNIKGYLETSLSMGFFDVNNDIPIELEFKGEEAKNKEVIMLQNYILTNKDKLKNVIFVLDRAYCSYKFIDFCNKNQINYVVRFRNNCNNVSKNNRVITFNETIYETVTNDNIDKHLIGNKKFLSVTLKTKNKYTLITNLNVNDYNDEQIKNIYHQRWNIEVFFKILKHNFKFSDLRITNAKQNSDHYSIHNIKILIIYLLSKIMEKIHLHENEIKLEGVIKKRIFNNKTIKNNIVNINPKKLTKNQKNELDNKPIINVSIIDNKKVNIKNNKNENNNDNNENNSNENNNNERKCILKPCITNIIKGVYELLTETINGKLTSELYKNIANQYIKYNKTDPTISNKRICKTPFKKWYIKGYTNKSDSRKLVNYMLGFTTNKLNKNLNIKFNNSTIIKINYL